MNQLPFMNSQEERIQHFLRQHQQRQYAAVDRMFGVLMIIQWLAGLAAAYWISPQTWDGPNASVHPHVWLALSSGTIIASLPILLNCCFAGHTLTRYVNSVAQVLFSVLLIHLTGGRIETHFHVFGSLAFLACYRDWKVLIPATVVVAADHFFRGIWWPESVFGSASASYWRWLEHAGWVIFEDIFLTIARIQGVAEMRNIAARAVALEDTDRWKKSILGATLDAVVSIDSEGRITEWNRQAELVFGWSAEDVIGKLLDETIIPEAFREPHRQGLRAYRDSRHGPVLNQRIEVTALKRDGTEFPVELAITPLHQNGELSFCGFIRDITERKRAEQELLSTKEAAESANQAKSRFLANMSHEIRTPLNGILGFTELLRRGADRGDETRRREFIETIDISGRHLLTVINDVLDLSKIEAGHFRIDCVPCSPHQMLAQVVSILRVTAQKKGLSLDYNWTGEVPDTIETDPARLRQILMNLVGNAIKFTERGAVTITVSLEHSEATDQWQLKIAIQDTGIGISPEKLTAIFDPFVQGDSSVTRRYGGTGLGLSISQRLCHLLGGGITVHSQPGLGSLFTVTVDAGTPQLSKTKHIRAGDLISSTAERHSQTPPCLAGRQILVVEDGEVNRRLIDIILGDAGAAVTTAENGEQGLLAAQNQPFDAILLDMQMPVMDGYVAAREMRSAGITCPIIALTAHSMSGDAEKCFEAGCSHFLSKPVEEARLLNTLLSSMGPPISRESPFGADPADHAVPLRSTLPLEKPVYREIVTDYIDTLSDKMTALEAACRAEDFDTLEKLAHALKGSGGTAGFPDLTVAADRVVQVARRQSTRLPDELGHLRSVVHRVIAGRPTEAQVSG